MIPTGQDAPYLDVKMSQERKRIAAEEAGWLTQNPANLTERLQAASL
jgi:hypothetical protein